MREGVSLSVRWSVLVLRLVVLHHAWMALVLVWEFIVIVAALMVISWLILMRSF